MEISVQPELIDYGIHNEASNIRAHVSVLGQMMFVFPTRCGVAVMRNFRRAPAYQSGVNGRTAEGYLVPPSAISNIRFIRIHPDRLWGFDECLSTTEKGTRAVEIVSASLKAGRFPLWMEGEYVTDESIQVTGTDLVVRGTWKIEVKCDYRASLKKGEPHPLCTGNLYLQVSERNPLKRH